MSNKAKLLKKFLEEVLGVTLYPYQLKLLHGWLKSIEEERNETLAQRDRDL